MSAESSFELVDGSSAERETVQQKVYRELRSAIVTGRFVPGRPVTLRGVAQDLGVSPMPVREALRQLVAERALVMFDNRRVAVPEMSTERFEELCTARAMLEPELAAKAMHHAGPEIVGRMQAIDIEIDRALEQGDTESYMRRNHEFHFTLYRTASSSVFLPLVESLWLQVGPFLRMVVGRLGTNYVVDRHRAAVAALKAGDEAALRAAIAADVLDGREIIRRDVLAAA
ncbi:MAG: GntR family transcriptional regulator [Geminicoccaceae bacterium]